MPRQPLALLCCFALAAVGSIDVQADMPIPEVSPPKVWSASLKDFFRRSQYAGAGLSPSGKLIAAIVPGAEGRAVLVALDVKERAAWPVHSFNDADVTGFAWVNDGRLLMFSENPKSGLRLCHGVDVNGGHLTILWSDGTYRGVYRDGSDDVQITRKGLYGVEAYRVNSATGATKTLVRGVPHDATYMVFDNHMRLRALTVLSADKKREAVWYRASEDTPWTVLADFDAQHVDFWPAGFSADDQTLYVVAPEDDDILALFAYDVQHRHLADKLVGVKGFDIQWSPILSTRSEALIGVRVWTDKPKVVWLDPDFARAQVSVDAALPDTINDLSRGEEPGSPFLVFAHSDRQPGKYFLLDSEHLRLEQILTTRPWIDPERMSAMRAIRYQARDGLTIRGYLTLPKGRPERSLPLVALVHDGPYRRDYWGYDAEVQFLASLGYAVFQPNFRGSDGYGLKFFKAGWRNWGLAMQDDVTDGVEYLATQGTIDRRRVCIMGGATAATRR